MFVLVLISSIIGKICVPINPMRPDDFNVSQVPTLTQCINEMGDKVSQSRTHEEGDSLTPQCLEPYMATFRNFLKGCEQKRFAALKEAN